jgi:tetratricopeptide (TPR) repeat protein
MHVALLDSVPNNPWLTRFSQSPGEAVAELLGNSADVGSLDMAEPALLLIRWLAMIDGRHDFRNRVDAALSSWIDASWGQAELPSAGSHTGLTIQAWITLSKVIGQDGHLSEAAARLRQRVLDQPEFLDSLRVGAAKDPLAAAYLAIAKYQRDTDLVPLWLRISRLVGQPLERGAIAVQALSFIPLADANRFPLVIFQGYQNLGVALYERYRMGLLTETRAQVELDRVARWLLIRFPAQRHRAQWVGWWHDVFEAGDPFPNNWLPKISSEGRQISAKGLRKEAPVREWRERAFAIKARLEAGEEAGLGDADRLIHEQLQYARLSANATFLAKSASSFGSSVKPEFADYALQWLATARIWDPSDPYLWTVRTGILLRAGRLQEAVIDAVDAARRFPENIVSQTQLADALWGAGRFEEAEKGLLRTLSRWPNRIEAVNNLGLMRLHKGDDRGAEELFRHAVELDETDIRARQSLRLVERYRKEGPGALPPLPARWQPPAENDPELLVADLWLMRQFSDWKAYAEGSAGYLEAQRQARQLLAGLHDSNELDPLVGRISLELSMLSDDDAGDLRRLLELARDRFPQSPVVEYYEQRFATKVGTDRDPSILARVEPLLRPVAWRILSDDPRISPEEREMAREELAGIEEKVGEPDEDDLRQTRLLAWYLGEMTSEKPLADRELVEEEYVEAVSLARLG